MHKIIAILIQCLYDIENIARSRGVTISMEYRQSINKAIIELRVLSIHI